MTQHDRMVASVEAIRPKRGQTKPVHVVMREIDALARQLGYTLEDEPVRQQHQEPRLFRGVDFSEPLVQEVRRPVAPTHGDRRQAAERKETPVTIATPKDQAALAREYEKAAQAAHPGMSTGAALSRYFSEHPEAYDAYRAAPPASVIPSDAAQPPQNSARGVVLLVEHRVNTLMAANPKLTYAEATSQAFREDPDLHQRYRVSAACH